MGRLRGLGRDVRAGAVAAGVAIFLVFLRPGTPAAHDIPVDVLVQAFLRPADGRMRVLVRVPLAAMRDIEFPTRGPGFLDLPAATPALRTAAVLWVAGGLTIYENDEPVGPPNLEAVRVSLPSDRSFESFASALAHVTGDPLPAGTDLLWNQALLDVLLDYPIGSARSAFSVDSDLARLGLRVATTLRFQLPDGPERAFHYAGDPGLVRLDPRWHQAARRFVALGFEHILSGTDHLLFLLCLVIPFRRVRELVLVVTAFTVAHSVTLIGSALGFAPDALWFPPLIEALIAASIVYVALENVVLEARDGGSAGLAASAIRRRWILTCAFGLVHGFGFSFVLRETLQFAGGHLLTSLVSFNVGIEVGQLVVLVVLVPGLGVAFRLVPERIGATILSALVAHTAWHWMTERGGALGAYAWTANDALLLADGLRWLIRIVVVGGVIWGVKSWMVNRRREAEEGSGLEL